MTGAPTETSAAQRPNFGLERPTFVALAVGFGVALLGAIAVCARAAGRGLDLTDEGIYLITYRWYSNPELTFTSSSAIFGPIFRMLGWNVAALRLVKLGLVIACSANLGLAAHHFARPRIATLNRYGRLGQIVFALIVTFGGVTIYSWLPQSPGYNDLAIFLSAVAGASVLRWVDATGRKAVLQPVVLGAAITLLAFVKWPSAFGVVVLLLMFAALFGVGRRIVKTVPSFVAGALGSLLAIQLAAGKLFDRITSLSSSSGTVLKGVSFKEAYLDNYLSDFRSAITGIGRTSVPLLVVAVMLALGARRFSRLGSSLIIGAGVLAVIGVAWQRQWFVGGSENVRNLELVFPLLMLSALGIWLYGVVCTRLDAKAGRATVVRATVVADADASSPTDVAPTAVRASRELWAGVGLLLLLPLAQALGTGNPPLTIAACHGSAFTAGILLVLLIAIDAADHSLVIPALAVVAGLGLAPLSLGVRGVWQSPFRITGGMSAQTVAAPELPALKGIRLDPTTADVLRRMEEVLNKNGKAGAPGLTTFNGTGLAFALGLKHPPAAVFVEEALPDIVRVRIAEACDQHVISAESEPVILTAGEFPRAATAALQDCKVDFPEGYAKTEIVANGVIAKGTVPQTLTIWIPKAK